MPIYKDDKKGTWFVVLRYNDFTGKKRQTTKRGFKTKRDAKIYESNFILNKAEDLTMSFGEFYKIYYSYISKRIKLNTLKTKEHIFEKKILPYFKDKPINQIKAADIRKWQGIIVGKGFKPTYQKALNEQLSIIFNFARKYYGLKENPCLVLKKALGG